MFVYHIGLDIESVYLFHLCNRQEYDPSNMSEWIARIHLEYVIRLHKTSHNYNNSNAIKLIWMHCNIRFSYDDIAIGELSNSISFLILAGGRYHAW